MSFCCHSLVRRVVIQVQAFLPPRVRAESEVVCTSACLPACLLAWIDGKSQTSRRCCGVPHHSSGARGLENGPFEYKRSTRNAIQHCPERRGLQNAVFENKRGTWNALRVAESRKWSFFEDKRSTWNAFPSFPDGFRTSKKSGCDLVFPGRTGTHPCLRRISKAAWGFCPFLPSKATWGVCLFSRDRALWP